MLTKTPIDQVLIESGSEDSRVARRSREILRGVPHRVIEPFHVQSARLSPGEYARSKRTLFIARHRGRFFKRCPGAKPGLACCNYFVLNLGLGCNMDCSYCYLQSFINSPYLTVFSNIDDALCELSEIAKELGSQPLRVGTGEVTDSLSLDPLTLYSHDLLSFFRDFPLWTLELKTKSNQVDQFLSLPHAGNVIVSWSVNPPSVIQSEEHFTASLEDRIHAALKCAQNGFKIAFHFDPILWHPEWKSNYEDLVRRLCSSFDSSQIQHVSMGTLRVQPEQRHMMRKRFGVKSLVNQSELFLSRDGKLRYNESQRQEMFKFVQGCFNKYGSGWNLALCMEMPESWAAQGGMPKQNPGISSLFDNSVTQKFKASGILKKDSYPHVGAMGVTSNLVFGPQPIKGP